MPTNTKTKIMAEGLSSTTSPIQSPPLEAVQQICLLKPVNKKSRFWTHFSVYDPDSHPDKKRYARCNLCGKDISVRQGTGGLKNHMKFKHPEENAKLFSYNRVGVEHVDNAEGDDIQAASVSNEATPAQGNSSTTVTPVAVAALPSPPPKKKAKMSVYDEITSSRMGVKRGEDFDMWCKVRREIKDLKAELATEGDEEAATELKRDIMNLKEMKAGLDDQLGFSKSEDTAFV